MSPNLPSSDSGNDDSPHHPLMTVVDQTTTREIELRAYTVCSLAMIVGVVWWIPALYFLWKVIDLLVIGGLLVF